MDRATRTPGRSAARRRFPPWGALAADPRASGGEALGPVDWLAVLLGPPREAARRLAARMLEGRDLTELATAGTAELAEEFALSTARAARVVAAFALGRTLACHRRPARPSMRSARAVFELLHPRLQGLERESFHALLLDGKHRLRRLVPVSEGTLTTSLVHPREVFRPAVRESAAAIVVAHNHPSGDPEPSLEDVEITRRLVDVGSLLGVPLLDHVVVGEQSWVSLRERMDFR